MAAPTTPGVFTSPTLNQVVDESILVSWGASTDADGDPIIYRLYRDDVNEPSLITITDNGDGTWQADNPDSLITVDGAGYFEIDDAHALYLDPNTYVVNSTSATGVLIGDTTSTSMLVDTSQWADDTTVRFRVEAYANGEFSSFRYSDYFTVAHPKLFRIGADQADAVYIGSIPVDAIYIGNVQVW